MKKIYIFLLRHKTIILLTMVTLLSGIIHGTNMLHYPYFENDEGTYMAQAWSFISHGKFAPYTYWYDHAPAGWMFDSLWIFLTGGLFSFGFSLNSARVFMLVLHISSTILLYKVTRKISDSDLAASITCLFFALSPLGVYFQRRFLLDNVLTFWILVTLTLILFSKQRLLPLLLSAITFGIGVLSKENGIFFMPVCIALVASEAHTHNRIFAVLKWITIAIVIISLYPLYAYFKKELFPNGSIFSPSYPHVSLLGSLHAQASRGTGLPFWNAKSDFMTNLGYWIRVDPFFIIVGGLGFFAQAVHALFNKKSLIVFSLTLSLLAFLMSGKLVINFYVVPFLPFLAICIGITIDQQLKAVQKLHHGIFVGITLLCFLTIGTYYARDSQVYNALHNDETTSQIQTINWIKKHIDPHSFIASDYYGNLDLGNSRFAGDPVFTNADWYWKSELDSDIRDKKLHNDPKNITYTLFTYQMYKDMQTYDPHTSILRKAVANSRLIYLNNPVGDNTFNQTSFPMTHPNGNWDAVLQQNTPQDNINFAWITFKKQFIASDGGITNYQTAVSSQDIAETLLFAVAQNDKNTYDKVYLWAQHNLLLPKSSLFATTYGKGNDGIYGILNSGTTIYGDENIAYSLLLAYEKWHDSAYQSQAKNMITDIWNNETVPTILGRVIVAGNWTSDPKSSNYVLNPSYFTPFIYKQFALVDTHNWKQITDSGYTLLDHCSKATFGQSTSAYLAPNWCTIDKAGNVAPNKKVSDTDFSYDATHVIWNIANDYLLTSDTRALTYLNSTDFWTKQWQTTKRFVADYYHNGQKATQDESLQQYDSQLVAFSVTNPMIAEQIYMTKIATSHSVDGVDSYWGSKTSLTDQYWTWMSSSLYTQKYPNSSITKTP